MSLQSKTFLGVATILLSMSLGATACDDPAEGKAKAKVEDADPKTEGEKNGAEAAGKPDGETAAVVALSVDAEASKVEWVGSKVTGSHPGGFKTFSAQFSPKDGKAAGGSVSAEIDTKSLYSDSDKLTGHLISADFFGG
jgi:polyisoprenoid-binding protein YceI